MPLLPSIWVYARAGIALAVIFLAAWPVLAEEAARESKITDLQERVAAIRSIDPKDEDFSDLAPLAEAIGDAWIVQLGESTHGSGASFAAKARLVRYLHRELNFDVLLWESGLYDVRIVNESLRSGADAAPSAALGVFPIWSWSAEILPLFEYARDSHASDRPLEMAGIDVQFSGRSANHLKHDLLRFCDEIESESLRRTSTDLVGLVMGSFGQLTADGDEADIADLDQFVEAVDALLELLSLRKPEVVGSHDKRELAFVRRVLANLRIEGINRHNRRLAERAEVDSEASALRNQDWNWRDAGMANNVKWMAESWYPDRKLIIWAHNGHIVNAYISPDWSTLSHEPINSGMTPMGVHIANKFGDSVYTVSFTAFDGEWGFVTAPGPHQIEEPPEESLEALLKELGHAQAFLNFRALPANHWLRQPSTMAVRAYHPEVMEDWTRVVDGVVFIERMTPATPVRRE